MKLEPIEVCRSTDHHWQTHTEIIIHAPIEKIWKILTDWNSVSTWSSSLLRINIDIQNGGNVIVSLIVDEKPMIQHLYLFTMKFRSLGGRT